MFTRWQVYNFLISTCLSQFAPVNGPDYTEVYETIQSVSGTTSVIVPYHTVIRAGTAYNPSYIMLSGTTYYANYFGVWTEYLDGVIFSVQAVDAGDNPILDGTIGTYTGSASGNRKVSFSPPTATEVWGFRFSVSGGYPPEFLKISKIAEFDVRTSSYYVELEPPAPVGTWSRDMCGTAGSYFYDSYPIGGGLIETRTAETDAYGTEYILETEVDILPGITGSGVLYYLESTCGPNKYMLTDGWNWWEGPPPPTEKLANSYVMSIYAPITGDDLFMGYYETWDVDHFEGEYINDLYGAGTWIHHREQVGLYCARVFFSYPSYFETSLSVQSNVPTAPPSMYWYLKNARSLKAELGFADSATKFRLDIETIDIYNICSP